jgi:hypothetical protein
MGWLKGKRTIIGGLLMSGLSAVYFLDQLLHETVQWWSEEQYLAIGGVIAGLTTVSMRLGIASKK